MPSRTSLLASQRVVQICLLPVTAIALSGGALQMYLGEPQSGARLDNVHRFMAGIYFGSGLIALWARATVRQQGTLIYLIAFSVLLAGIGRLVSISQVGIPEPAALWIGYLCPELIVPFVMVVAHAISQRSQVTSSV
jgi:Domain of unknown function (DUF4345)